MFFHKTGSNSIVLTPLKEVIAEHLIQNKNIIYRTFTLHWEK